jgi:hypothetical protein
MPPQVSVPRVVTSPRGAVVATMGSTGPVQLMIPCSATDKVSHRILHMHALAFSHKANRGFSMLPNTHGVSGEGKFHLLGPEYALTQTSYARLPQAP